MAIRQLFSRLFKTADNIRKPLPFVQLFGYEKSQGATKPQDFSAMVDAYRSWVYACVNKNAFSVAKCKLRLYKERINLKDGKADLEEITEHPFLDIFQQVNPFSNKFEMMSLTQIYLELTGNSYWWMPKDNLRVPYMIWNIPAHWVSIVPSKKRFIEGYVVTVPGKGEKIPFPEDEVVHYKFPSPFNLFYGVSPVFGASYGVDLNTHIKKWSINFFMNNAQPSGALYTESSVSPEQYQRLRDLWNKRHRGVENAGRMAILEGGLKYQQIGSSLKDAKFENISREIRDEILAMFGVPASKLGLVEDVNRANAEANDFTYQKETILPRLALYEEKINEKILPMYDAGLVCKFDSPVPQDREYRLREKQTNIQSGLTSIDEEREKEGLEPFNLPETSAPLIPFNLVPAGNPSPAQPQEPEKAMKEIKQKKRNAKWNAFAQVTAPQERLFSEVMKRYFQRQHRIVMQNFNKYREANNAITKDVSSFILFNINEENERLATTALPNIRSAFVSGLTLGMNDTNHAIDFNLFEPNIMRFVTARSKYVADLINKSTTGLLEKELQLAFQNGESIDKISGRIQNVYNFSEQYRSKRIAQTEVIGATNDGTLTAYREAGMEAKEWITAKDERVRDAHRIDGQVVNINDDFRLNSGTNLQYPGDRSTGAPAADLINCRCTVNPIRTKEG